MFSRVYIIYKKINLNFDIYKQITKILKNSVMRTFVENIVNFDIEDWKQSGQPNLLC